MSPPNCSCSCMYHPTYLSSLSPYTVFLDLSLPPFTSTTFLHSPLLSSVPLPQFYFTPSASSLRSLSDTTLLLFPQTDLPLKKS